ncbi:MAG: chromate resistance protein [Acidobacteria bacterium]|nr:chromate resistance protein [Acidobacteriota bacterium]
MKWITRERAKVDRVACPWLIRHFIDPGAEFFFVPAGEVMERARALDAIPFDVPPQPGVKFCHREGKCTFEVLLEEYKLTDLALHRLARIVHGADIAGEEQTTPQSAGLKAIAEGFSETGRDDFDRLEKQFPLYDALYAWCGRQERVREDTR